MERDRSIFLLSPAAENRSTNSQIFADLDIDSKEHMASYLLKPYTSVMHLDFGVQQIGSKVN